MGNIQILNSGDNCLKQDRLLDNENRIYIGIGSTIEKKSSQAIRFGDYKQKYYRLLDFKPSENKLEYKFENDITMILEKEDDDILLNVTSINDNINVKKVLNPIIREYHTKICLGSYELDRIYNFIRK